MRFRSIGRREWDSRKLQPGVPTQPAHFAGGSSLRWWLVGMGVVPGMVAGSRLSESPADVRAAPEPPAGPSPPPASSKARFEQGKTSRFFPSAVRAGSRLRICRAGLDGAEQVADFDKSGRMGFRPSQAGATGTAAPSKRAAFQNRSSLDEKHGSDSSAWRK